MTNPVYRIDIYRMITGKEPFNAWYTSLADSRVKMVIKRRLDRLQQGNAGVVRSVGHGILELKIDLGPGYRVYYVLLSKNRIVVLTGGSKASQREDIINSQFYLEDLKRRHL